jgi:hypothetical protein
MGLIARCSLALLLLGACSVPSFSIAPDPVPIQADACTTQMAAGKACGGDCPLCADGAPCTAPTDCASGLCEAGVCVAAPTCSDGLTNGSETDVDCGGSCDKCPLNEHCTHDADCSSGSCQASVCAKPAPVASTCSDGQKDDTESDVDCGGSCTPCAVNRRCGAGSDCTTLVCATVCQPPSCTDAVRNGSESDVDCGGSCGPCGTGLVCNSSADCKSSSCKDGHCLAATCTDEIKNEDETATDCGGSCPACPANQVCAKAADCQSLICAANNLCAAPSCGDTVKNGNESDVDCGMGCTGCQSGLHCNVVGDCASTLCKQAYCVPATATGGVLVMTTWIATASDAFGKSSSAQAGIDNNSGSSWGSGTNQYAGMWYEIDMNSPQIFFSVTLDSQDQPANAPILFDVYLSLDGTFTTPAVKSIAGDATKGLTHVAFSSAQVARYVKLVLTNSKPNWWGIRELTVNN